jgi:hypothetical protein
MIPVILYGCNTFSFILREEHRFPADLGIFYFTPGPDLIWGPPNFLSSGYQGLFSGVKRTGREADLSPSSSAEVRNAWRYISTPVRFHGFVFRSKRERKGGDWRGLRNEELHNLITSPNIVIVINSRRIRWIVL